MIVKGRLHFTFQNPEHGSKVCSLTEPTIYSACYVILSTGLQRPLKANTNLHPVKVKVYSDNIHALFQIHPRFLIYCRSNKIHPHSKSAGEILL